MPKGWIKDLDEKEEWKLTYVSPKSVMEYMAGNNWNLKCYHNVKKHFKQLGLSKMWFCFESNMTSSLTVILRQIASSLQFSHSLK